MNLLSCDDCVRENKEPARQAPHDNASDARPGSSSHSSGLQQRRPSNCTNTNRRPSPAARLHRPPAACSQRPARVGAPASQTGGRHQQQQQLLLAARISSVANCANHTNISHKMPRQPGASFSQKSPAAGAPIGELAAAAAAPPATMERVRLSNIQSQIRTEAQPITDRHDSESNQETRHKQRHPTPSTASKCNRCRALASRKSTKVLAQPHAASPTPTRRRLVAALALLVGAYCCLSGGRPLVVECAPANNHNHKQQLDATLETIPIPAHQKRHSAQTTPSDEQSTFDMTAHQQQQQQPAIDRQLDERRLANLRRRIELALAREQQVQQQRAADESNLSAVTAAADDDETLVLVLADTLFPAPAQATQSIGRLIKRSGISDQRLAEIQMIRALKKQLEKASKLATSTTAASQAGAEQAAS